MNKESYPEAFSSSDLITKNDIELIQGKAPMWWNYFLCGVKGVVSELLQCDDKEKSTSNGIEIVTNCGYAALMDGKIPPCAGLSSSSAVVVAAALCKYSKSSNIGIMAKAIQLD